MTNGDGSFLGILLQFVTWIKKKRKGYRLYGGI